MSRMWDIKPTHTLAIVRALEQGNNRLVCPACGGGSTKEQCMSLFAADDSGAILATCHRAQCTFGTQEIVRGTSQHLRNPPISPRPMLWKSNIRTTLPESLAEAAEIVAQLGYPIGDSVALRWIEKVRGGLAYPIIDGVEDRQRGYIVRPFHPTGPKALTYKDPDYNGMSWYLQPWHAVDGRVILVEDVNSALCAYTAKYSAISLNGTLLNDDRVEAISKMSHVAYLMLDPDATGRALKYLYTYGRVFNLKVRRLDKDLKNMEATELVLWLCGAAGPPMDV